MSEKRFSGDVSRLRSQERVAALEVGRVVSEALAQIHARSVLDVGTGSGIFAEAFAARGLSVCGVDVNPQMASAFRRHVPGGQFGLAPAENLPFANAAFDVVFLGHVLHETDQPQAALGEARRVGRLRVLVFEWPYREDTQGPPLAHRLKAEIVLAWAKEAGFSQAESLPLQQMNLFRLTP
jgi:ubiquinone/menaquinone biosynthesis C-methylase UbiE